MTNDERKELESVRVRLKTGQYDGTDIMSAWLAIDQLLMHKSGEAHAKDNGKIKKIEWEKTFNDPQNFNAKGIDRIYDAYGPTPFGAFRICSVTVGEVTTNFIWESPLTKNLSIYTNSLESALQKCEANYETAVLRALETEGNKDDEELVIYDT